MRSEHSNIFIAGKENDCVKRQLKYTETQPGLLSVAICYPAGSTIMQLGIGVPRTSQQSLSAATLGIKG